ncbi:MAG: ClpXP protease specificity-enhancing factor SspB [Mariprofundaceae bacterium]
MSLSFSDAAKAKKLREYFARHGRIYIVVNATLDEVDVPEHFRGDPALRLVLNSRMPQPILIRDDLLESDFSFSGTTYPCRIPMHAIWATYLPEGDLEQGIIWDDCVPEMIQSIVKAVRNNIHAADDDAPSLVEEKPAAADQPDSKDEAEPAGKGRKVGHLRVIK